MNTYPFQIFIDLITFDQGIQVIEKDIQALKQKIAELNHQEQLLTESLEKAKQRVQASRKEVDTQELIMKESDQLVAEKQKQLDAITNHKEYKGLQTEIQHLQGQQHEHEELLMNVWNQLEAVQKEYDKQQEASNQKVEALHITIQETTKKITALQEELDKRNNERLAKEQNVPQEWLEKYSLMRARVANPVVPVDRGVCSACFYIVSEQDLIQLKRRQLLQCKECYRLLYIEEVKT